MVKIKVLNKTWKVIVRSDKHHEKLYPSSHAVAILDDRKIHVRRSSLNITTITHELIHAWQAELSFYELQLDDDQVEEFFAELFAKYGQEILTTARLVVNSL